MYSIVWNHNNSPEDSLDSSGYATVEDAVRELGEIAAQQVRDSTVTDLEYHTHNTTLGVLSITNETGLAVFRIVRED
jgi:hypothetical protein